MPLSERIRLARKQAGLSMDALASRIGVTAQSVSKYEHSQATPSPDVLDRIASATGMTLDFMFRPSLVDLGVAQCRKRKGMPAKTWNRLVALAQDGIERRLILEEILYGDAPPELAAPTYAVQCPEDAEKAADRLRVRLGLGEAPVPSMVHVAEAIELRIVPISVDVQSDRFDGLAGWARGVPYAVYLHNGTFPGDRQRFTLAHELGHIILDMREAIDSGFDEENLANRFAGALLIPRESLLSQMEGTRRVGLSDLLALKSLYGASLQCLVHRAGQCGLIDDATQTAMWIDIKRSGWWTREPNPVTTEKPGKHEELLGQALSRGLVTLSRAAELAGKSIAEVADTYAV